ncbi:methyl-accepting chemotaxis protein [Advenella alkanexedens]|uniref:methyl-accepting chemotaxis protein n=1 Tax=Advenella alkanexedens TaxID=1481665 RepID=UPI002676C848|nr:PAS domain-containing methyl-accepting chemotaxis protein [Advenella alkanexedens]WKU18123.1 methyl-accepting chemotaxis protein [Advenella alkanexedens]
MRKNLPVNDIETLVQDDQYLISKTDLKGRITYCNPAFVELSGFTREELIGKPHNIIRHPDMPELAFQDLWESVQNRKPWTGLVKNRRKDGGFYWVLANVTPIFQGNEVTGYASVRVKADSESIAKAEALYRQINNGEKIPYTIKQGRKVPVGIRRIFAGAGRIFQKGFAPGLMRAGLLSVAGMLFPAWLAATQTQLPGGNPALFGIMALFIFAIVLLSLKMARDIRKPIDGAADIIRQISAGNLSNNVHSIPKNEMGELYYYLDMMRKALIGISGEVMVGADANSRIVTALQKNSQTLAMQTEDQAASLQETAASLEELTVTVKQNAENARSANSIALEGLRVAENGSDKVNQVVRSMEEMNDSSRKIESIVKIIEDIAFQTNLLAINASVESARAGEAGRGFGVVAAEVRNLSQKSSDAAKEIKSLVHASVEDVTQSSRLAEEAGSVMKEIMDSVQGMVNIMAEISTASVEQSSGLQQINLAVNQMDHAVHQNSAMVQNLSQTSVELGQQAQELKQSIGVLNNMQG